MDSKMWLHGATAFGYVPCALGCLHSLEHFHKPAFRAGRKRRANKH